MNEFMNELRIIKKIIEENYFQEKRIQKLKEAKFKIEKKVSSMGPGGTGLIRFFPKKRITRIQIGCNYGGFSTCVVLKGDFETKHKTGHLLKK